jgi:hypothetical protein
MTDDLLFGELPESLSPYEDFKRRHGIEIRREFTGDPEYPFTARIHSHDYCASGRDERDAVYNLAYNHDLAGWRDVSWD